MIVVGPLRMKLASQAQNHRIDLNRIDMSSACSQNCRHIISGPCPEHENPAIRTVAVGLIVEPLGE